MTNGGIECSDQSTGAPIAVLTGIVSTNHPSTVSWDSETGAFHGGLSGGFNPSQGRGRRAESATPLLDEGRRRGPAKRLTIGRLA